MKSQLSANAVFSACAKKINWIILTAIFAAFIFASCTPRSVRSKYTFTTDDPYKSSEYTSSETNPAGPFEDAQEPDLAIQDFKKAHAELMDELNESEDNTSEPIAQTVPAEAAHSNEFADDQALRGLPTLEEQMQTLRQNQGYTDRKIQNMEYDISDIKNTVDGLKNEITLLKNSSRESSPTPKPNNYKKKSSSTNNSNKSNKGSKSNLIQPDENISPSKKNAGKSSKANAKQISKEIKSKVKPELKPNPDITSEQSSVDTAPETVVENLNHTMNQAIDDYKNGNYTAGINKFNKVISSSDDPKTISKCQYYIGEAHFKMQKFDEAVEYFGKVLETDNMQKDEAQIMIAEAKIRSGQIEEAKKEFENLIANYPNSRYIPRARKMLQQL